MAEPAGRARPARLLLVEDDRDTVAMLDAVLRDYGFVLDTARCGQEGLERCRQLPPDLVLLDIGIPPPDGFVVLKELKADARLWQVPVLLLTHGYLREARLQRARRLLLDTDLLVKTIALEVGYWQTSDLTRAMAARFGATPTALRAGSGGAAPDEDA